ncbi:unnamed protein product [Adineta ricciae]|uniref:Uncharacterized protein n=1 Tax=Adineta ricciae TaxID=249248 RepID=A0A815V5R9_ADIRI|nr:unnamed protein product [Adineta ricciae]
MELEEKWDKADNAAQEVETMVQDKILPCDLLDMITHHIPMIISLNELGSPIPEKTIKQLLFSYNIVMKAGTNSYGGVVLAINKKLNAIPINSPEPNIVAAETTINDETFIIASIYSPRNEKLSL